MEIQNNKYISSKEFNLLSDKEKIEKLQEGYQIKFGCFTPDIELQIKKITINN